MIIVQRDRDKSIQALGMARRDRYEMKAAQVALSGLMEISQNSLVYGLILCAARRAA